MTWCLIKNLGQLYRYHLPKYGYLHDNKFARSMSYSAHANGLYECESWFLTVAKRRLGHSRTKFWGEYIDLRQRQYQEGVEPPFGEELHTWPNLIGKSNQGGQDEWGM
jgi:hypothetical protein